ncbi:enoyl-CoA hydratase/isomerase family protein [Phreatobacter sp. AB_2022a]|uniref:enoyl-CoA hydratase/isomerase family protein n=1 Tax=Phreatobacter sp. AB_2022a TaxID=3003134 RepID=UPI00228752DB|nr:enoyl-CoA hydratase/isomerase family protein [Phreatobacter sp. AB_2022a]MCZ0736958.1 enoyl-CoA hydratase/isomerase family protein [Phreatobacter sp. AB_2022a]
MSSSNSRSDTSEILIERRGKAGLITLNRPAALNALTLGMVRAMRPVLEAWAVDPAVTRVMIMGAGDKAFCAGGDIRVLHDLGKAGRQDEALTFWREEYELNILIKRFPKPFIALVDGIVMGGGVGVSVHGSHVVAGEKFAFAMPEVGIGFFPDVGGTYFLPRIPGEIGTYFALTGARMKQGDALSTGLATHAAASAAFPALIDALTQADAVDSVLEAVARTSTVPQSITARRGLIDRAFRFDRVEEILAALDAEAAAEPWAGETAASIRLKSPTSLKIALAQVRAGKAMSFEAAMAAEFRIVSRLCRGHDFYEGVRAVIIDKDNRPAWRPAELAAVTREMVAGYFAPLGAGELVPPAGPAS